ncbi:hypothetical protein E0198_004767 [Clavispora lusitaniae]|nr:hypothetical protein E0198_004767 [Clavispora lusitaniae]
MVINYSAHFTHAGDHGTVSSKMLLLSIFILAILAVAFYFRRPLIDRYSNWRNSHSWRRGFQADLENGLTSDNFDIEANIRAQDPRSLDENAREEIQALMEAQQLSFDEARLKYFRNKMAENGVGSDGVPTDPRTVTLS